MVINDESWPLCTPACASMACKKSTTLNNSWLRVRTYVAGDNAYVMTLMRSHGSSLGSPTYLSLGLFHSQCQSHNMFV